MCNLTSWGDAPVQAFKEFVVSDAFAKTARRLPANGIPRTISKESAKIYNFMFANVIAWIAGQKKTLLTVTQADLVRFINRTDNGKQVLNSKIAYRYLRLLERCYEHMGVNPNPAKQAIMATDSTKQLKDDAGRTLSTRQLQRFFDALPVDPPRRRRLSPFDGWKRRRDRAMQVVIALAGLSVSEAIGLLLGEVGRQVNVDGSIELTITPNEKHATSYPHTTTLPREGVDELRTWMEERKTMAIPGHFVFPANDAGRKMIRKTVYMQIRGTFERAGMDLSRSGGRTLRNTFAQRQLATGTTADELKDILGLALERSAADYQFTRIKDDPKQ